MILKIPGDSLQKVGSEFTTHIDSDMDRDKKFREFLSIIRAKIKSEISRILEK